MRDQMKTLITGCNGFAGKWLCRYLQERNYDLFGLDIQKESASDALNYRQINLLETDAVTDIVASVRPDLLFHLAGISFLPQADKSPHTALNINLNGTVTLLEAIRSQSPHTRLLLIGSAREYSDTVEPSNQIFETVSPEPTNFYGISKYAGELIGLQYHRQYGIDVRCTRSFNHTGPGQSPDFVCSEWARQVAAIQLGKEQPELTVGDIGFTLDFSDVRDVVDAYHAILTEGSAGEVYNVCSGNGTRLSWICDYLCNKADRKITVVHSNTKIRVHKTNTTMVGNHDKLTAHTGWKPAISFQKTLNDLYDYWYLLLQES